MTDFPQWKLQLLGSIIGNTPLAVALESSDREVRQAAEDLLQWGSEWTVLMSLVLTVEELSDIPGAEGRRNMRDARFFDQYLLMPLSKLNNAEPFYMNAAHITDANYVKELRDNRVVSAAGDELGTFDPASTATYGGTEFTNAQVSDYYSSLGWENGSVTIRFSCGGVETERTFFLYSRRVGTGNNAVYLMNGSEQSGLVEDITSQMTDSATVLEALRQIAEEGC